MPTAEALGRLRQAAAPAEQLRLPGEAWTAHVAVGELALEAGDQPLARASFGRAARILHDLAAQIADPNRRRAFLSTPGARQALRAAEHRE